MLKSMHFGLVLLFCSAACSGWAQLTETTTTVAPGRFLIEMDALSLTLNKVGKDKFEALGVATTFLSTGLTSNWDVQVGAELYLEQQFNTGGLAEHAAGLGDIYVRTKWRFFEDKTTGTEVALMPFVKAPTNTGGVGNKSMEGGLIVPWKTDLVGGFSLTAMGEVEFLRNANNNGYDSFWSTAVALQRDITETIGFYGEATLGKSTGGEPWEGVIGGGITLALSDRICWDYGIYRGISGGADDWQHVLRLNWGF